MTNLQFYLHSLVAIFTLFLLYILGLVFKKPVEAWFGFIRLVFFYTIILFPLLHLLKSTAEYITELIVLILGVAIIEFSHSFFCKIRKVIMGFPRPQTALITID